MHETHGKRMAQRAAAWAAALLLVFALSCQPAWADSGTTLIPLGRAVGIKLFADGVLVVGVADVDTAVGRTSPARDCGLREGDLILQINGESVSSSEQVQSILQSSAAQPVTLTVRRGGRTFTAEPTPVECDDSVYRLGTWIRDSMAGIGTMTFYDPATGSYGALGHGITDVDTAQLMPLASGAIMETSVRGIKRGEQGDPGELKGDFSRQRDVGSVSANTEAGIFGTVSDEGFLSGGRALPVARGAEVETGPATILSTISGDETREYAVEIVKIYPRNQPTRNLLIRVTDPQLLEATGGIVQGMSGSPILQNGRFVGAVTHVLVNDPTQGYGILMENMLRAAG
jgi:stage IV sporulation protein B